MLHSLAPITAAQQSGLQALGASVTSKLQPGRFVPATGITEALVPADQVDGVSRLAWVKTITPAEEPEVNTGSVTSQGVAQHKADVVQAAGINGTGVSVGVTSNGVQNLAAAVASGDLPNNVNVLQGAAATRARRCSRSSTTWPRRPRSSSTPPRAACPST